MIASRLSCLGALLLISISAGPAANASDAEDLSAMLHSFLAGASAASVEAHDRFWAEDLVYTSSSGTRTNKAGIMASVNAVAEAGETEDGVVYTAEDVDIRLYGDTAIVAFRLVGTGSDPDAASMQYFNTGTFLKREGSWRAIAWQATRIPPNGED